MSTEPESWNPEFSGTAPGDTAPEPPAPAPAPPRPIPIATFAIAAACVVVFVLQTRAGGSRNPYVLLDFGASYRSYFVHGQYFRAVMPLFLHIGWWHLAMNMVPFLLLGPTLEEMYGYGRFSCIYLGAGIIGVLASMFISGHVSAGASGAIMGVIAAIPTAGHVHRNRLPHHLARVFRRGRLTALLVAFMAMEIVSGFKVANVDNWGHLGGLVGGALLAILIPTPGFSGDVASAPGALEAEAPRTVNAWRNQQVVVVPLAVVAIAMWAAAQHYRVAHQVSLMLVQAQRLRLNRQPDQALDLLRRAAKLDPGDERPHENLGAIELEQHQEARAIEDFKQALSLNPDSGQAAFGLASAYQASGDLASAQHAYEALLKMDPRSLEGHEALADLFAGQKRYQEAIDQYQTVLRINPNAALAHNNLGWIYATSEDSKFRNPGAALDHARKAVALTAWRMPDFIDTLAEAFYAGGSYADAVKVESRALLLAPGNPEFQRHMARYREAAENPNPSIRD